MSTSAPQGPPALSTETAPGSILAGKYRVERVLGKGGMGIVVEARHLGLDARVALKFLLPEYAQNAEAAERFRREARAAKRIKSEHVASVSDVGTLENGCPYMEMEFLEGADLDGVLQEQGPMAVADALDFVIQACEALAEAHSYGIVHRDIKPANLFLSKRPDGSPIVKVLDFGISKTTGAGVDNLTRTTSTMGSALYMSPEQMQMSRAVDHRTDIYAMGVALYELLCGKQPYLADTLPQLIAEILTGTPTPLRSARPDVPEELAAAIEKAYARSREARYQSVAELVIGLAPWAPPRAQNTIDRVTRMANLEAPRAGSALGRAAQPPPAFSAGTQILPQGYQPSSPAAHGASAPPAPPPPNPGSATVALPGMAYASSPGAPPGPPPPGSISRPSFTAGTPGPQAALHPDPSFPFAQSSPMSTSGMGGSPMSTSAMSASSMSVPGAITAPGLDTTPVKKPSNNAGLAVTIAIGVVSLIGLTAGAMFFMMKQPSAGAAASGAAPPVVTAAAASASASAAPEGTAAPTKVDVAPKAADIAAPTGSTAPSSAVAPPPPIPSAAPLAGRLAPGGSTTAAKPPAGAQTKAATTAVAAAPPTPAQPPTPPPAAKPLEVGNDRNL